MYPRSSVFTKKLRLRAVALFECRGVGVRWGGGSREGCSGGALWGMENDGSFLGVCEVHREAATEHK